MSQLPSFQSNVRMASSASHQVSISMPCTSPQATRRLLPRITTKKTENNSTVVLVGGTRMPAKGPSFGNPAGSPPSDSHSTGYISSAEQRTPDTFRKETRGAHPNFQKTDSHFAKDHHHHHHHHHHKTASSVHKPSVFSASSHHHHGGVSSAKEARRDVEGINDNTISVSDDASASASGFQDRARREERAKLFASLSAYYRNAPIRKLSHPLEENIFSSLFITLFAVAVAIVVGIPFLIGIGMVAVVAVGLRYLVVVLHGLACYAQYICSEKQHSRARPPQIFPRDRLAFANDIRWLDQKKKKNRCQSILHTLLVFEGSVDVTTLRHLVQTRVLRAETPEGELAYPRLLQKLVHVTAGYLWELDLAFDIQNHVLCGPTYFTSEVQLQQYIGRLLTRPLPLTRPLWEIRVLPSYYGSGKDTMAIVRVHQCLADGMSLIRILSHSLADYQQMHVPQRPHFAGLSFGFNVLRSMIVGPVTIFLWWFGTFRDKNLFSIPLPRLRRRKRRKWLWQPWSGNQPEDEPHDEIVFTSSIGSSSSGCSLSSSGSSRAQTKKGKHVEAFKSPLSSPRPNKNQLTSSPVSSVNRQNILSSEETQVHYDEPPAAPPSSTGKPTKTLMFEGILSRSARLNKCLGRKLSASKSSLRSQHEQSRAKRGRRKGRRKTYACRKRRKRRARSSRNRGMVGRKESLASTSSFSSSSSSCSSRCTGSSASKSRQPPAWNVIWSASMTMPKVARIKQIMRSSYNDVLLSACAGSVRMYLQDVGIPYPGDVQVVIPVDLRNDIASPKQSTRLGCKVSSVLATVPSGIESAIPRLWATRHRLDELKASADSVVAYGATTILMNILPHRIAIPILDSIVNKASFQFSNLPGPTTTMVIGGYPVKGIYPIYPAPGRLRAAVSVFTYADQVHVTVITHRSLVNAGPKILRGMTEQVEQLSRQLSQRRVPGESRRSMRHFNQANNAEITKPPTRQIQLQLQFVQEELAQLNSKLEAQGIVLTDQDEYGFGACHIPPPPPRLSGASLYERDGYYQQQPPFQPHRSDQPTDEPRLAASSEFEPVQVELQTRLKTLKNEFAQLIGELRRRSSIVEGIAMSFEVEENEDEYRKPRKRALSVVSMTRRSSIFSARSNNTAPDSPVYASEDDLPSSPATELRSHQQPGQQTYGGTSTASQASSTAAPPCPIRHASSPMRTTAV